MDKPAQTQQLFGMPVKHSLQVTNIMQVPVRWCETAVKKTVGPALTVAGDEYQSSVVRYLVENIDSAKCYDNCSFPILTGGHSKWHLDILKAVFPLAQKSNLCMQKKT